MWKVGERHETSLDERFHLKIKVAVFVKHIEETKRKDGPEREYELGKADGPRQMTQRHTEKVKPAEGQSE